MAKTLAQLTVALSTSLVGCTTAQQAQQDAFNRYSTRLGRLNVSAGGVLALAPITTDLTTFDVPVQFVPGPALISGLQFDLLLPAGFAVAFALLGPEAIRAQKSVSLNPATGRVLLFGLNQETLQEGHLLTLRLTTTAPRGPSYSLGIKEVIGSDPVGQPTVLSGMVGPVQLD